MRLNPTLISWLQVSPLGLTLMFFFGFPMLIIVFVSFCQFDTGLIIFEFTLENYAEIFTSELTYALYLSTVKYTLIVWVATVIIGFSVSYFLVFHIHSLAVQIGLFLVCTIPFWTSVIIRMISWLPILGREGLINSTLLSVGAIDEPISVLLYSDLSVIVAYIHLYTLFMIVPIFNSLSRIDRSIVVAAQDGGASPFQVLTSVVLPLTRNGIALGSIFIVTLVMGDFFVVRVMSGGQSASVVSALFNEIASLQYPPAAANAVVLVIFVTVIVSAILRVVDVRKEISE